MSILLLLNTYNHNCIWRLRYHPFYYGIIIKRLR